MRTSQCLWQHRFQAVLDHIYIPGFIFNISWAPCKSWIDVKWKSIIKNVTVEPLKSRRKMVTDSGAIFRTQKRSQKYEHPLLVLIFLVPVLGPEIGPGIRGHRDTLLVKSVL